MCSVAYYHAFQLGAFLNNTPPFGGIFFICSLYPSILLLLSGSLEGRLGGLSWLSARLLVLADFGCGCRILWYSACHLGGQFFFAILAPGLIF